MPAGPFSNSADVRALLDFLQVKTVYLLGISFGAAIAIDFALAYPNYTKALILAAPSVNGAKPSERIKQFWEEEDLALEKGDIAGATELNLKLWVDGPHRQPKEVDTEVREQVREMQTAIFKKEIPEEIEEIELTPPAIERLGEVKIPVQVLIGDLDLDEKLELVDRIVREVSTSRKVVLSGVAHMLNMEKGDAFNQHVLEFLSKV